MIEQVNRNQVGKVILSLDVFESLIRLDGAQVTGVEFDSIEQTVTIGVQSGEFPERQPGYPVEHCALQERNGRIRVLHPRVVQLDEVKRHA